MISPHVHLSVDALDRGPVRLEGILSGEILELSDQPAYRNVGDITYALVAERKSNDVLVRGHVEVRMELECSRSGVFFSTTVEDSAFLRDYSLPENGEMIDLTPDLREAILLNIPLYPVSPEARSATFILPTFPPSSTPPPDTGSGAWGVLDNLKLK